jgi:3-oxoacyl-[acyl-carrier-protein] synthase-3
MRPMIILGSGTYLPKLTIDNHQMSGIVDTSDAWILSRTGISSRHLTAGESTADMGEAAARLALEAANITAEEIGAIIVTTLTPDHFTPSAACVIQGRIGATNAFCFDINAACTGFVYALDLASRYLLDPEIGPVLIISSEILSKIVDYSDRTTCILFGDAAAAVIVARPQESIIHSASFKKDGTMIPGILSSYLRSEGENGGALVSVALPVRHPFLSEENIRPDPFGHDTGHYLSMNGQEVFRFAVRALSDSVSIGAAKAGLSLGEIDWIIPHQANARVMEAAVRRLQVDADKVVSRMRDIGNTSSASIPICLDELIRDGRLQSGQIVAIAGFGGGLTYGSVLFRY